jgi:hypothetical protein
MDERVAFIYISMMPKVGHNAKPSVEVAKSYLDRLFKDYMPFSVELQITMKKYYGGEE